MRRIEIISFTVDANGAVTRAIRRMETDYQLLDVKYRFGVASSSGTFMLTASASGVAVSAGTTLLTGVADLSATITADTDTNCPISGYGIIPGGSTIGFKAAGTMTSLVGLVITMIVRRLKERPAGLR